MQALARIIRSFAKWRFKALGRASILDVADKDFERVLLHLKMQGWKLTSRYRGFDAGIDYDRLRFRKRWTYIKCEWDNWCEWSVEGPAKVIKGIASEVGLSAKSEWRWAQWDTPSEKQ
jgi:hypothetical protein